MATPGSVTTNHFVELPHKPNAKLAYTFAAGSHEASTMIVFLNGLMLHREPWSIVVQQITRIQAETGAVIRPAMLSYDRYGQGDSDPDPQGTHNMWDVCTDLHSLIERTCHHHLGVSNTSDATVIFVANSIGCAIARLYSARYAGSHDIAGLVFLDSIIANSDMVSLFPDPDASGFDPESLPADISVEMLRHTRQVYAQIFHPSLPNPEELDRSELPKLLPLANEPRLRCAKGGESPFVVVVGSDPVVMGRSMEEGRLQVPARMFMQYHAPVWAAYNRGLVRLTDDHKSLGPLVATGCNHFIQQDDPVFVAGMVVDLIEKLNRPVVSVIEAPKV